MSTVIWPSLGQCVSMVFTTVAIKAMDDSIDRLRDDALGIPNWATKLGSATTIYTVVLVMVASAGDLHWTVALIAASYIIGMFGSLGEWLPTHLRGWQESLLVAIVTPWYLHGITLFGGALAIMLGIQLFDDTIDGTVTLAWLEQGRFSWLGGLVLFGIAFMIRPRLTVLSGICWGLYTLVEWRYLRRRTGSGEVQYGK